MRLPPVLALLLSLGCATTQLPPASGFEETLDVYRHSKGKKALVECSKNAERSGVQATCYLFATGDEPAAINGRDGFAFADPLPPNLPRPLLARELGQRAIPWPTPRPRRSGRP